MDRTQKNPVTTKAITAAILNLLGDIFCQVLDTVFSPHSTKIREFRITTKIRNVH